MVMNVVTDQGRDTLQLTDQGQGYVTMVTDMVCDAELPMLLPLT